MIIRKGTKEDLPQVLALVNELALYERAPQEVVVTLESMQEDGFGENPIYFLNVAEDKGKIIGIALFYVAYSTWKGRIIYLDDLVVTEQYRTKGIGKLLMDTVVKKAQELKVKQVRWHVLDWNTPAIKFYEKINAHLDNEWIQCKLGEDAIRNYKFDTSTPLSMTYTENNSTHAA